MVLEPCMFFEHLVFTCPVARVVWVTVGNLLGTSRCPSSLWKAIYWFFAFLPGGKRV
jgi:hypothetical protein